MDCAEPLLELFTVHRAIERVLTDLVQMVIEGNQNEKLKAGISDLERVLLDHCQSEVGVILPTLEARVRSKQALRPQLDLLGRHEDEFSVLIPLFERILALAAGNGKEANVRNLLVWEVQELDRLIRAHLSAEEENMHILFNTCLQREEQGRLLVATVSPSSIRWMMGVLRTEERAKFLKVWNHFANELNTDTVLSEEDEYVGSPVPRGSSLESDSMEVETSSPTSYLADSIAALSSANGRPLASENTPQRSDSPISPLMELHFLRFAVYRNLQELLLDVRDLDVADEVQVQSLERRILFLQRIHTTFTRRERTVLLPALEKKQNRFSALDNSFARTVACFEVLVARIRALWSFDTSLVSDRYAAKEGLLTIFNSLMRYITNHMEEGDVQMLPLVLSSFSFEEQGAFVRQIMSEIPTELSDELFPWMFTAISTQEQQVLVWSIFTTSSRAQFARVGCSLGRSLQRGSFDYSSWKSLISVVPDLAQYSTPTERQSDEKMGNLLGHAHSNNHDNTLAGEEDLSRRIDLYVEHGPIREVIRVHKAIRVELRNIVSMAHDLSECRIDSRKLEDLAKRVSFLERIVREHSRTEDTVVLPTLEKRCPGVTQRYEDDHTREKERFVRLAHKLKRLRCEEDASESCRLARSVRVSCRALMDDLNDHLEKEETQLWPLLITRFSVEEQEQVVGRIFGLMPAPVMKEMLGWMIPVLPTEEGDKMLQNVLTITKSTLFEKWLMSWLPKSGPSSGGITRKKSSRSLDKPSVENGDQTQKGSWSAGNLQDPDELRSAIMEVARNKSLTVEKRSELMQKVMLARWEEARAVSASESTRSEEEMPVYTTCGDGSRVFGCRHYQRSCKILAKCCGKFYMCRLCHDEKESHVLDRAATEMMLCLHCGRSGPIGQNCSFGDCGKRMARYFCNICKLFDDNDQRSKYHCHSCNVCRVGKGLGIDYFHCMTCNVCMNIRYENHHKCVEKSSEGQCPVCRGDLSTSVKPIKYLRCGHLMHTCCYASYVKTSVRCPVCTQSFADVSNAVERVVSLGPTGSLAMLNR